MSKSRYEQCQMFRCRKELLLRQQVSYFRAFCKLGISVCGQSCFLWCSYSARFTDHPVPTLLAHYQRKNIENLLHLFDFLNILRRHFFQLLICWKILNDRHQNIILLVIQLYSVVEILASLRYLSICLCSNPRLLIYFGSCTKFGILC